MMMMMMQGGGGWGKVDGLILYAYQHQEFHKSHYSYA